MQKCLLISPPHLNVVLIIQLQNTTKEMGATGACPGTHYCSGGSEMEMCGQEGFQLVNEEGHWATGDALLMNMNSFHRGSAHTDPDALDRVIPIANQVQIEQRVILRISPQPSNMRRSMLAELPRQTPATRLVERPYGKCLNAADIIGVSDRGSRLVMYMRDRGIITAQLEKACSPRDFYLGFYVEKNEDGRLCVDRDRLMSRAGAKCRISNFNRLVAVTGDR